MHMSLTDETKLIISQLTKPTHMYIDHLGTDLMTLYNDIFTCSISTLPSLKIILYFVCLSNIGCLFLNYVKW